MSKVSIETRQRLLEAFGSPHGVTIARQRTGSDDVIAVQMLSSGAISKAERPDLFEGFRVEYRVVTPGQAGVSFG
jgi:hypothetical protein